MKNTKLALTLLAASVTAAVPTLFVAQEGIAADEQILV